MGHLVNPTLFRIKYVLPFNLTTVTKKKYSDFFDLKIYMINDFLRLFFFRYNKNIFNKSYVLVANIKIVLKTWNLLIFIIFNKTKFFEKKLKKNYKKIKRLFKKLKKKGKLIKLINFVKIPKKNYSFIFISKSKKFFFIKNNFVIKKIVNFNKKKLVKKYSKKNKKRIKIWKNLKNKILIKRLKKINFFSFKKRKKKIDPITLSRKIEKKVVIKPITKFFYNLNVLSKNIKKKIYINVVKKNKFASLEKRSIFLKKRLYFYRAFNKVLFDKYFGRVKKQKNIKKKKFLSRHNKYDYIYNKKWKYKSINIHNVDNKKPFIPMQYSIYFYDNKLKRYNIKRYNIKRYNIKKYSIKKHNIKKHNINKKSVTKFVNKKKVNYKKYNNKIIFSKRKKKIIKCINFSNSHNYKKRWEQFFFINNKFCLDNNKYNINLTNFIFYNNYKNNNNNTELFKIVCNRFLLYQNKGLNFKKTKIKKFFYSKHNKNWNSKKIKLALKTSLMTRHKNLKKVFRSQFRKWISPVSYSTPIWNDRWMYFDRKMYKSKKFYNYKRSKFIRFNLEKYTREIKNTYYSYAYHYIKNYSKDKKKALLKTLKLKNKYFYLKKIGNVTLKKKYSRLKLKKKYSRLKLKKKYSRLKLKKNYSVIKKYSRLKLKKKFNKISRVLFVKKNSFFKLFLKNNKNSKFKIVKKKYKSGLTKKKLNRLNSFSKRIRIKWKKNDYKNWYKRVYKDYRFKRDIDFLILKHKLLINTKNLIKKKTKNVKFNLKTNTYYNYFKKFRRYEFFKKNNKKKKNIKFYRFKKETPKNKLKYKLIKNFELGFLIKCFMLKKLSNLKNIFLNPIYKFLEYKASIKLFFIIKKFYGVTKTANMFSEAIIIRLLKKNQLKSIIKGAVSHLTNYFYKKMLGGFLIIFCGRFTRKDRAIFSWYTKGIYSRANRLHIIDYSNRRVALKYGSCSLRISLTKSIFTRV